MKKAPAQFIQHSCNKVEKPWIEKTSNLPQTSLKKAEVNSYSPQHSWNKVEKPWIHLKTLKKGEKNLLFASALMKQGWEALNSI